MQIPGFIIDSSVFLLLSFGAGGLRLAGSGMVLEHVAAACGLLFCHPDHCMNPRKNKKEMETKKALASPRVWRYNPGMNAENESFTREDNKTSAKEL